MSESENWHDTRRKVLERSVQDACLHLLQHTEGLSGFVMEMEPDEGEADGRPKIVVAAGVLDDLLRVSPFNREPSPAPATRQTYTFVHLEVSAAAYEEIKAKLLAAGYGHAVDDVSSGGTIDMHGLALVRG